MVLVRKKNLIANFTSKFAEFKIPINSFKADLLNEKQVSLVISVYLVHLRQLGNIVRSLKKSFGMVSIKVYIKN